MRVGRAEVQHVASLARLRLSPEEEEQLVHDLSRILDYVDQLAELPLEGVEPMAHVLELKDGLREDLAQHRLSREAALAVAPSADGEFFRVPKVIE